MNLIYLVSFVTARGHVVHRGTWGTALLLGDDCWHLEPHLPEDGFFITPSEEVAVLWCIGAGMGA